jgi:hypothetical protein
LSEIELLWVPEKQVTIPSQGYWEPLHTHTHTHTEDTEFGWNTVAIGRVRFRSSEKSGQQVAWTMKGVGLRAPPSVKEQALSTCVSPKRQKLKPETIARGLFHHKCSSSWEN